MRYSKPSLNFKENNLSPFRVAVFTLELYRGNCHSLVSLINAELRGAHDC